MVVVAALCAVFVCISQLYKRNGTYIIKVGGKIKFASKCGAVFCCLGNLYSTTRVKKNKENFFVFAKTAQWQTKN